MLQCGKQVMVQHLQPGDGTKGRGDHWGSGRCSACYSDASQVKWTVLLAVLGEGRHPKRCFGSVCSANGSGAMLGLSGLRGDVASM